MPAVADEPVHFASAEAWWDWLEENHATAEPLSLCFFRTDSGRGGISYREALEGALAYGWIDGVRRGLDAERWTIRFSRRKPGSGWSKINRAHVERLKAEGRMRPPGLAAYEGRDRARDSRYSFEQASWQLAPDYEAALRAEPEAFAFFSAAPISYRRPASWWVMSAKREETRQRRLSELIAASKAGRRIALLRRAGPAEGAKPNGDGPKGDQPKGDQP
jgi:uncharacterized protein YdeI (YjbR/CyaY-like superfamily)